MAPESFFRTLRQRVHREWIICFLSALCVGLVAHLYKLVNWLPNWDSLVFRYDAQDMTKFGRCFLSLACGLSSYYELPWLNGLLGLVYIGLAAVCVCRMFSLHRSVTVALVGALMASFPTITSTMVYSYVADGYCLALLCVCAGAMLLAEGGWRRNAAAVCLLTFSLGIYQAYITVAILLLLMKLADGLLFEEESAAASLKKAMRFLACGILAGIAYLLILKLAIAASQTEMSNYQGISGVSASLSLGAGTAKSVNYAAKITNRILQTIRSCVLRFFKFFFGGEISAYSLFNTVMLALLCGFIGYAALCAQLYRSARRLALLLLYLVCAPFGATALYLLNPSVDYHNLMTMGYAVFFLFFILFYERLDGAPPRFVLCKNWMILGLSAAIIFNFVLIANISYHKLQMAVERSYGIAIRMADRIEQTEGALECKKLAVLGYLPHSSEEWSAQVSLDITGVTDGLILYGDNSQVGQSVITAVMKDYCNLDYTFASLSERRELAASAKVSQMPCWPEKGSVAIVDDYVVLKLSEGVGVDG